MTAQRRFTELYGPHFTWGEFHCKCQVCADHGREIDTQWFTTAEFKSFMEKLIWLRADLNFPFQINSGYRCPAYNDSLYGGNGTHMDGPHTIGAADIGVSFERAYKLIRAAMVMDLGVGPTQHGPVADRFVHVDNIGPRIWTY